MIDLRQLKPFSLARTPTPFRVLSEGVVPGGVLSLKDESCSGHLYGGNKVRKLEYLLADAKAQGATRVATCGAIGSNHCLATAFYAREYGFTPVLHHFPQEVTEHVLGNLLALSTLPVELVHYDGIDEWLSGTREAAQRAESGDSSLYWIPAGGTTPLGALGFVHAAYEMAEQCAESGLPLPDRIYVPVGTAGTLIGLALGFSLLDARTEVVGVQVTPPTIVNEAIVERIGTAAARIWSGSDSDAAWQSANWTLRNEFLGDGYGIPTASGNAAVDWAEANFSLHLENTYTAKCVAALRADIDSGACDSMHVTYGYTLNQVELPRPSWQEAREALPEKYRSYLE
jgi:D-cysteine desulfhydrase